MSWPRELQIVRFCKSADVPSPPVLSSHYLFDVQSGGSSPSDSATFLFLLFQWDVGRCLALTRRSLREQDSVALVMLGEDWIALIYPVDDEKKVWC